MPACHDEDDASTGRETCQKRRAVLIPNGFANRFRFRFLAVFHHIVDKQQVGTLACDAAAKTDRDHAACMSLDIPVRLAAVRTVKPDAEEGFTEVRDLLAVPVAELLRKIRAVADLDHAPIGISSKEP